MAGKPRDSILGPILKSRLTNYSRLQVNVISTFLLCSLLVPLISKTAKLPAPNGIAFRPHLVVATSDSMFVVSS